MQYKHPYQNIKLFYSVINTPMPSFWKSLALSLSVLAVLLLQKAALVAAKQEKNAVSNKSFLRKSSDGRRLEQQTDLDNARNLWGSYALDIYTYSYALGQYESESYFDTIPYFVQVRGERISVWDKQGEIVTSVPSISDLFDIVQDALDRDVASLIVSYNSALGYPTRIDIDYSEEVMDEEVDYTIEDFVPLFNHRASYAHARAKWESQKIDSYKYQIKQQGRDNGRLWTVSVNNNEAVAATPLNGDDIEPSLVTMDALFDTIQRALDGEAQSVNIVYSQQYGFPTSIRINYDASVAARDPLSLEISDFVGQGGNSN